jgi:YgiT-type zinc finger domain-containing protein
MAAGLANSKEEIIMECLYCRGVLVRKRIGYAATRKGYHLIIDEVPAWVCEQCGEPLFDEKTVDAIQEVLEGVDNRLEKSVLSLAAA